MQLHDHYRHLGDSLIKSISCANGLLTIVYADITKTNSTVNLTGVTASSIALANVTGADDLKAIEALTGTSGFLKKTAANTWSLDTNTYLTSLSNDFGKIKIGNDTLTASSILDSITFTGGTNNRIYIKTGELNSSKFYLARETADSSAKTYIIKYRRIL